MKKLIYLLMAVLVLLTAVSCKKDNKTGNNNDSEIVMPDPSVETLAASEIEANSAFLHARIDFSGASRDNVYYGFFWGTSENLEGTYTPGEGALDENNAYSAEILGLTPETEYWFKAFVEIDGKSYSGGILNFTTEGVKVESVSLDKSEYTFHTIGATLTLTATVLPAEAADKSVEWTSSDDNVATVTSTGVVKAVGNGPATITVTTKDQGHTSTCAITVAQHITDISLDKTTLSLNEGEEYTLTATVNPDAADQTLKWTSTDEFVATVDQTGKVTAVSIGPATIKAEAQDGSGKYASCSLTVKVPYTAVAPEAVDLGIVVDGKNIKWGSFNLGATKPEEYGDRFAWGEIDPKDNYSWSTYIWCNGSHDTLTKYNDKSSSGTVVDNKAVLDPDDDAAHAALAGKWRMPTDEEWTALRTQCTWAWTKQNGVNGRLVTASNGNSIFLPAAGYRGGTALIDGGSTGYYWSSSLLTGVTGGANSAHYVYFTSLEVYDYNASRYRGLSVRPVWEE